MKWSVICLTAGILFFNGTPDARAQADSLESSFDHGWHEATLTSGVMFSPFAATRGRPVINYTLSELQAGYMLADIRDRGWLRGNAEVVADVFGGAAFQGKGDYLAGGTCWLRYNFVPPGWQWIPFVQGGLGLTAAQMDHRLLGETFNFNLNLGVGTRYFISPHWSLNLEYRYQHISNANISRDNIGINAHGPICGVSYFF